jgi:hypothetical protein
MTSLPLPSSSRFHHTSWTTDSQRAQGGSAASSLMSRSHEAVAKRYMRELGEAVSASTSSSPRSVEYPRSEGAFRLMTRDDFLPVVRGGFLDAHWRALRSGPSSDWHHDDVHVILPIEDVVISAGKDGRAVTSRIVGSSIEPQSIHPLYDHATLFTGETSAGGAPLVADEAWVTAGASVGRYFALGRRDGTLFRGELSANEAGERIIKRRWAHAKHQTHSAGWSVYPETPRLKQRGAVTAEDPNSRRIYGLGLLPSAEDRPPALVVACGKLLWCTSAGGRAPVVLSLEDLLTDEGPHQERILALQGMAPSAGSTVGSIMALSRTQTLWMRAEALSNPLELWVAGRSALFTHHTSAHWMESDDGPCGALGQSRTGTLTFVQWDTTGHAECSSWRLKREDSAGSAWSIDHLDEDLLVSGHERSMVRIWDVRAGEPEMDLKLPFGRVSSVATRPGEQQVLACAADDHCREPGSAGASMVVWDIRKGDEPLSVDLSIRQPSTDGMFEMEV